MFKRREVVAARRHIYDSRIDAGLCLRIPQLAVDYFIKYTNFTFNFKFTISMSGGDALLEAEFEAGLLQSTYITGYCSTAYTAVLIYDYFLTLPDEISLFWNAPSKAPSGTILFALNRFVALGLIITNHVASDPVTYTFVGCKYPLLLEEAFVVATYVIWAVVSGIRVHALTRRNWFLSVPTFLLAAVPLATNFYLISSLTIVVYPLSFVPIEICGDDSTITAEVTGITLCDAQSELIGRAYSTVLLLSRSCSLASDLIVLIVTLYYVWPRSSAARSLLSKGSISHALLKNGISYFAVLGLINALEIILYLTTDENFVNVFLSPASTLVVARFLLEIRAAVYRPNNTLVTETLGTDTEFTSTDGGAESRMWQSLEFAKKLESAGNSEDSFASTEDDEAEYEMGYD
ncbi:uncharacterized protein C8Q71DRAFT_862975 [Rhodofomes roseus]|uniref:DUF6533 domain-containing protein n=1 Tax=Rhodofomes roseus TaxID=34475 RepID=A0ABQ8JZR7_9APHY|nr:uncharacterized protein C8Q71DRAFT_862975 [Rhodofomes roseus]KAH9829880.1 hypothetical protein C8Q71DRAFT_862975 [Rhodofomes roseus]